jgi:hypothetical protein
MNKYPFQDIFKKLPPKDFVRLFRNEANQTKAFFLSFAAKPSYVKKVLDLYRQNELSALVSYYLKSIEDKKQDTAFIQYMEVYIENIINEGEK